VAYHISLDGLDLRRWKRRRNRDIWNPVPIVVTPRIRASETGETDDKSPSTRKKARALWRWILHPEPIVGASEHRVGELGQLDIDNFFSQQNAAALWSWIVAWVK